MRRRDIAPRTPWVLGLLGLIPFFGAVAGGYFAPSPYDGVATTLFFAYAACVLSFLGGSRWGFEIGARPEGPGTFTLIFAILPSLAGTFAAVSQYVAPILGLGILAAGFVVIWLWDFFSSGGSTRRWPIWYRPLRTVLTFGAVLAISIKIWLVMHA